MSEHHEPAPVNGTDLEAVVEKISLEHGFDVRGYKRSTLYRRIRKRMSDARCPTVEDYLVRLETDPNEYPALIDTVLINVTEFFRDPPAWEYLRDECLGPLLRRRLPGAALRVWSVGCASGEEAYSLAILLAELADGDSRVAKVYATDMDEGALAVARAGVYGPPDMRNISAERRQRYFDELPGGKYRVRRDVRSMVIYGHHNVLEHPPISRLDLLVCRNLLIYFDTETQQQLLRRFHYAVRDDGFLFLGKAETLMSRSPLFRPLEPRHRIFMKVHGSEGSSRPAGPGIPATPVNAAGPPPRTVEPLTLPVDQARNPILLLDADGQIVAASPSAREIFAISDRLIGGGLAQLDERLRPMSLRLAIEDARTEGRATHLEELQLSRGDGAETVLDVEVRSLAAGRYGGAAVLVWCQDITRESELSGELARTRQELETTSEELQTTNEELETTNEELQSTNEELETTNEELQSTNEELETTIEELQSTNEELETANDELRARQAELDEHDRFQSMVLSSLQMGVIVVWSTWEVVSWSRKCEDLWGVREEEAIGQNLFGLDTGMPFETFRKPLIEVMHGDGPREMEVDAVNRRGRPVRCRVRLMPLTRDGDSPVGAMILIETATEQGG